MENLGLKKGENTNSSGFNTTLPPKLRASIAVFAIFWTLPITARSQNLPSARPEQVGFSSKRLDKITDFIRSDVEKGNIPGAVMLIARHGKAAYFQSVGYLDPQTHAPMVQDGIFRIYSMSKPIAEVAAMMLVEEGKISLDDPVSKYLPSFSHMKVGMEKKNQTGSKPNLELVDARNPITIRDLMRHTSGITYGFIGKGLVKEMYNEPRYFRKFDISNAQLADEIAKLPLAFQPGTTWDYSHSTDVLARVLEVVSGQTLYQFEKERLLDPLGMKDTSFYVKDKEKQGRIAEALKDDRIMAADAVAKEADGSPFLYTLSNPRLPVRWESAGSGMVSTVMDYGRLLQMLLNGGSFNGKRYLKTATVKDMTSNQLTGDVVPGPYYLPGPGYGFGLGFAVRTQAKAMIPGTVGDYFWYGAGGTIFWVDPKKDMFVVFMMQSPKQVLRYQGVLRQMVYAALRKK